MSERLKLAIRKQKMKDMDSPKLNVTVSRSIRSAADKIMFLQQTIGNQAVQRLMRSGTLQAKLRIGAPGDVYEQEADRVADAVMRMPQPQAVSGGTPYIQRASPKCEEEELKRQPIKEEEEEEKLQRKPVEEEEELQAKATSGSISEVNPDIESNIQSLKGAGQTLSPPERAFFEPRFGADFGNVRVHNDTRAAYLAQSVNARAFTLGNDVVFGAGQYAPGTSEGRCLLAHELTHVRQQRSSSNSLLINRYPRGALEELAINRGTKSGTKTRTAVGSGVKICYVPLSIFPNWLPNWAAPANHAFIEFDDGWSAGFTMLEGESKEDARVISPEPRRNDSRKWCFNAERKDSEECQSKPINDIKSCIKAEARKNPGKYHLIRNNCGDWVKRTFDNCCLKPNTPWHIY
ncbi:MAG: DUF4157 domain-containing protein [Euryarchaeota archaeon]|nr:DUF4157 domain-containing protein [Euryarchaeota archaeon]MBU4139518.1 DUF4157 domain-containing protein [Euryarchaeota archaeon]